VSIYAQSPSNSTVPYDESYSPSLSQIINSKFPNKEVEVLSETPYTVILTVSANPSPIAAETIDFVKQRGYVINAVTAFVLPPGSNQTDDYPELYTIFFSR